MKSIIALALVGLAAANQAEQPQLTTVALLPGPTGEPVIVLPGGNILSIFEDLPGEDDTSPGIESVSLAGVPWPWPPFEPPKPKLHDKATLCADIDELHGEKAYPHACQGIDYYPRGGACWLLHDKKNALVCGKGYGCTFCCPSTNGKGVKERDVAIPPVNTTDVTPVLPTFVGGDKYNQPYIRHHDKLGRDRLCSAINDLQICIDCAGCDPCLPGSGS